MSDKEQYVLVKPDNTTLVLPSRFRPTRSSPSDPKIEVARAFGYADVYLTGQDDGFEAAEDTVKQVVGTVKMPTEAALMSLITDWRRFVRASTKWRRMNSPTVIRREWPIQGAALTWAHLNDAPSNVASIMITVIPTLADDLDGLDPAG